MKVCLLCGESYGEAIDFCFRDGEVLASADSRQTPALLPRSLIATPTPSLAALGAADEDPDVARANRRALMRAAAANYLAPGQVAPGNGTPSQAVARLTPVASAPRGTEPPRRTPVPVSPLDQGLPQWDEDPEAAGALGEGEGEDFEDEDAFEGPPSRTGAIAAAVIGALVVVAIALGVGLLVVVGLGRQPAGSVTTTAMVESPQPVDRSSTPEPPEHHDAYEDRGNDQPQVEAWTAPTPQPFFGRTPPRPAFTGDPPDAPPAAASEFLVSLDAGGQAEGALLLYVDGEPQGVLPARVSLTPGNHVFRVMNGHSGSEMLQVTRRIDHAATVPGEVRELDLSR